MALVVDARWYEKQHWSYRLWDTQAGCYVTDALDRGQMCAALTCILADSGIKPDPSVAATFDTWLNDAERRGTNDQTQKAGHDFARPWRDDPHPVGEPGDLRRILFGRILAEQVVRAIFDRKVRDWVGALSPDARDLVDSLVVNKLMRGHGVATLRVEHNRIPFVVPLIAEIATIWADAVTVETDAPQSGQPLTAVFRLR